METEHYNISIEVIEIDRRIHTNGTTINNVQENDRLILAPWGAAPFILPQLLVQQTIVQAPAIRLSIPDQPYMPGPMWLGECVVCQDRNNEGVLWAYENGTATCGHPLCAHCARQILTTTSSCPKCRRSVISFLHIRIPETNEESNAT